MVYQLQKLYKTVLLYLFRFLGRNLISENAITYKTNFRVFLVLPSDNLLQDRRSKNESGGAEPYIPYIPLMIEKKIII